MNTRSLTRHPLSVLLIACAILALLLSACQPGNVATSLPTVQPTASMPATQAPTATQPPASTPSDISLDLSGLAKDLTVETVPAVPASAGGPIWEVLPQYRRVTLQGYPVTDHLMKAQIFILPGGGPGRVQRRRPAGLPQTCKPCFNPRCRLSPCPSCRCSTPSR